MTRYLNLKTVLIRQTTHE